MTEKNPKRGNRRASPVVGPFAFNAALTGSRADLEGLRRHAIDARKQLVAIAGQLQFLIATGDAGGITVGDLKDIAKRLRAPINLVDAVAVCLPHAEPPAAAEYERRLNRRGPAGETRRADESRAR
jgi:hypothetical protein